MKDTEARELVLKTFEEEGFRRKHLHTIGRPDHDLLDKPAWVCVVSDRYPKHLKKDTKECASVAVAISGIEAASATVLTTLIAERARKAALTMKGLIEAELGQFAA